LAATKAYEEIMGKKAKKPEKTSEERARERSQARDLDKEIREGEKRFKALARGKLGARSLLANKIAKTPAGPNSDKTMV
jgi:hypothetical protein